MSENKRYFIVVYFFACKVSDIFPNLFLSASFFLEALLIYGKKECPKSDEKEREDKRKVKKMAKRKDKDKDKSKEE